MKIKIKLFALIIIFANVTLSFNIAKAQAYLYGPVGSPVLHDELQSKNAMMAILTGTGTGAGSETMTGLGVNNNNPKYMLDVLCDPTVVTPGPTNLDINVQCPNCTPANAVGYRIGGKMFLWHNGDPGNVFCGVNAGTLGTDNTYVGNYAGNVATGNANTAIGSIALANSTGNANTALGFLAMEMSVTGSNNTAIGEASLYYNTGNYNTALGLASLNRNVSNYNTASGYFSGYFITNGSYNTADGYQALYGGTGCTGTYNDATGANSLYNLSTGSYNSSVGANSLYTLTSGNNNASVGTNSLTNLGTGSDNTALGYDAGFSATTDMGDLFLGSGANRTGSPIQNAAAIGYQAVTANSNQFEIGNNSVTTTLGMSGFAPTGVTRLELNTANGATPFNITATTTNPYTGCGTGWSGLRFDDLTTVSTPCNNPGLGVLSVNGNGDVIYVTSAAATPGIGYCNTPCGPGSGLTTMVGSGGYNLNSNNLYLAGNSAGTSVNNVAIGNTCCYSPLGKLDVLQASGSAGSTGIYVENTDPATTALPATIGIESFMPSNILPCSAPFFSTVAAWFEADGAGCLSTTTGYRENYAIFIPGSSIFSPSGAGGGVAIGYQYALQPVVGSNLLLNVNSAIQALTWTSPSDSLVKRNITNFKSGIKAIRALNLVSYQYNGIGGFDTSGQYVGVLAQNLKRVAPYAVKSEVIMKDTNKKDDTATILTVDEKAVLYTAVNAIKQVDSTVTSNQKNDSTIQAKQQQTIDSLRTVLTSIQNCLSTLCGGDGHALHHASRNVGSGDSNNTTTNVQDITLSSADAPLLYQNTPNPFSSGTKINYYLPTGTAGATIVFYDNYGNQIKQVKLSETGNGTLNITPENLTNGIYSYSLVVNGSVVDTKRMVLQK